MNFSIYNLGMKELNLYIPIKRKKYNVLIVSCFHGDERSSFRAVLKHMLMIDHDHIAFSYIPMANPTGVHSGTRENDKGENPNCGFNHPKCKRIMPETEETRCILNNIDLIKECARDGFLSLHEDKKAKHNYAYTYEQTEEPTEFSKALNYIDFCYCDNTLEDYLHHEGIPLTACIEVYKPLMEENIKMINEFIKFIGEKK